MIKIDHVEVFGWEAALGSRSARGRKRGEQ